VDWVRLDEGYFQAVSYADYSAAIAAFASKPGAPYLNANLVTKVVSVGGVPSTVSFFAATGNLLNWASSSKFDIQKKILTGGKYDANEQHLVSQSRGCAEHNAFKEVPVVDATNVAKVLTLAINGPADVGFIDSLDATTRISILGVTAGGFADSDQAVACNKAIDMVSDGLDVNEQGTFKQLVKTCLDYGDTNNIMAESNSAYNHSMHECWFAEKSGYTSWDQLGSITDIQNSCEHVYRLDMPPATITPDNSGYVCYGVYNHDGTNPDPTPDAQRAGYIGRCWEPSTIPSGCRPVSCPLGTPYDTDNPRCFPDDYMYECSGNFNAQQDSCNKPWFLLLEQDPASAIVCNPTDLSSVTEAKWTDDANASTTLDECIKRAVWDYCQGISMVEVIDPTDQIFNSGDTWGIPGALIDSGVYAQFGTNRPLLVMKGYVKKDAEASGEVVAPTGILHDVAADLRMGAMAFNQNGAATECSDPATSETIVKYCPDENKDGARVIAPIKSGTAETAGVRHVDTVVAAINDIRANAWTPLAEAIYNALGYYGQRTDRRLDGLDGDDFYTEDDDSTWPDPVQFWCQQNHILVITEGASTTDIHQDVIDLVDTYMPETLGISDSPFVDGQCLNESNETLLFGSTYFDDVVYYGAQGPVADIYSTSAIDVEGVDYYKQNILTHIVTTGALRDDGTVSECNPATIMTNAAANAGTTLLTGENPAQLEDNLRAALSDILSRVSAGSAASVISSSRSGSGAVYQAIFWPQQKDYNDNEVTWVGDVHGLFLDSDGLLWEDTDQDRTLDKTADERVRFYFDYLVTPNRTRVCYDALISPEDINDNGNLDDGEDTNNNGILDIGCANPVEIDAIKYLWSVAAPNAGGWLSALDLNATTQRDGVNFISDTPGRYIFTWNDLNNDGIVDSGEQVDFTPSTLSALAVTGRGPLLNDFAVNDTQEFERLINWLRGEDQADLDSDNDGVVDYPALRSRFFQSEEYGDRYWRLGDVIHSTPTLVGRPLESYHFVYQDPSYAHFAKKYATRRNVVYFGANDGMLHAINAGFFVESDVKFCLSEACADETGKPPLGAELWAYVPYNLQPHLKCLTDPEYAHKYYVDQRPRIFDVQIFADDCSYGVDTDGVPTTDCSGAVHPGGWGTILVGSMRMGGTPVAAAELNGDSADTRKFISSYFVLDITNPEAPPVLLGELTATTDNGFAEFGYTTASPAMVIMREVTGETTWYLIFGNGPDGDDGMTIGKLTAENAAQGKVGVLPLDWLVGEGNYDLTQTPARPGVPLAATKKPFRIPNSLPGADGGGIFEIPAATSGETASFVSDLVSVDYDVNSPATVGVGAAYKTDAVYFGTADGTGFEPNAEGTTQWNGGGRMFRLVTRGNVTVIDNDSDGENDLYDTYTQGMTIPSEWHLELMLDAQEPVSTGPGIGWDGANFWVYFGTGRFHDSKDKTDAQSQRFFGVKEPYNCTTGQLSWAPINWFGVPPTPGADAGSRGLMDVSDIYVVLNSGNLLCADGTITCRTPPAGETIGTFDILRNYIVGERCPQTDEEVGLDGWVRVLPDPRERNLGQATLLGGLVTFSTYKPFDDVCQAEGESFLYGVHYQTGTSWIKNLFGTFDFSGETIVQYRLSLGKGLALTPSLHVGTGDADATAFVQTSTGEIIEITQEELPLGNFKSGRSSWRQE
jgi:type IV pilus assembly protein PilY1